MPKILKILTLPKFAKKLRQVSIDVDSNNITKPEFKRLLADMIRTMQIKDGIGLAAPQIGQQQRVIVISEKNLPICMINPVITKKSLSQEVGEEGCLSYPNVWGPVKRYKSITCKYLDESGVERNIDAKGLMARAIQHEVDHLDGILFIDRLEPKKK